MGIVILKVGETAIDLPPWGFGIMVFVAFIYLMAHAD
jgi:hypothetical protein